MSGPTHRDDVRDASRRSQDVWRDDETDKVSTESSRTVAAVRAVDAEDPSVEFEEPLAAWLAGDDWLGRIRQLKTANDQYGKGLISGVSVRCLALDAGVMDACQDQGAIKQVVLVGAGMDTRPYRLRLPDVDWFEVDVPAMSRLKHRLIEQVPGHLRGHAIVRTGCLERVPIDLATSLDDLLPTLVSHGFAPDQPVLYVMEGLVYYLSGDENRQLFATLPAPAGSRALVTCIPAALKTMVNDPAVQERIPRFRVIAPSWKTDLDAFRPTLGNHWTIAKEVNLFDYAERTGRRLARDQEITVDQRDLAESYLLLTTRA